MTVGRARRVGRLIADNGAAGRDHAHPGRPTPSRRRRSTTCRSTAATISTSRCSRRASRAPTRAQPSASPRPPRCPAPASPSPASATSATRFVVDGLSANDDAADLAGTFFSQEVIREFQVDHLRRRRRVRPRLGRHHQHRHPSGTNSGAAAPTASSATTRSMRATRSRPRPDPLRSSSTASTFGGPLREDRTFLFANVEQTRQDRTGSSPSRRPTSRRSTPRSTRRGYRRAADRRPARSPPATTPPTCSAALDHAARRGHADRGALQPLRHRERERAQRRRAERRQPRHRPRRHRPDRSRSACCATLVVRDCSTRRGRSSRAAGWARRPTTSSARRSTSPASRSLGTATTSPTGRDLDLVQAGRHVTLQHGVAPAQGRRATSSATAPTLLFPGARPGRLHVLLAGQLRSAASTSSSSRRSATPRCASRTRTSASSCRTSGGRRGLTVNGGLRYDLQVLPDPIALDGNNVSPRLGVAWAPGDGRTVVRASGGLYFDRIPLRATVERAAARRRSTTASRCSSFGAAGRAGLPGRAAGVSGGAADRDHDASIRTSRTAAAGSRACRWSARSARRRRVDRRLLVAARRRASSCRATSTCRP